MNLCCAKMGHRDSILRPESLRKSFYTAKTQNRHPVPFKIQPQGQWLQQTKALKDHPNFRVNCGNESELAPHVPLCPREIGSR